MSAEFPVGSRVNVIGGPFKDYYGMVLDDDAGDNCLMTRVRFMNGKRNGQRIWMYDRELKKRVQLGGASEGDDYEIEKIRIDQLGGKLGRAVVDGPPREQDGVDVGPGDEAVIENIRHAERIAIACARARVYYHCPHLNTAHMSGDDIPNERSHGGILPGGEDEDFFLAMDLNTLRRCDAILMIGDWRNSGGALGELEQALNDGLYCCELVE